MNDAFDNLTHSLDSIYGLPGAALTLLFCLGIGYFLKMVSLFPNKYIPVVVVAWGIIWNILLRPPPANDMAMWQHYLRLGAVGFLIGLVASIAYDKFLKPLESRWPWLKDFLEPPPPSTPPNNPP